MAYDRELKDRIDSMTVAQLIHFLNREYDPQVQDNGPEYQSTGYFWAYERLNKLLPWGGRDV